jgi:peroxiredoxin
MNHNSPELENKNITRLILFGILIGFGLALVLFGIRSLLGTTQARQGETQTKELVEATPEKVQITSSPLMDGQSPVLMPTLTPVQLQFDQAWAAIGDPAPFFTLSTLDGLNVSLDQFKGRPVIINFWASWCEPCAMEMPFLQATFSKYESTGLMVLAINSSERDTRKDVEQFLQEHPVTFPILLDDKDEKVSAQYGIHGLPASYFIDKEGILRRIQIGAMLPADIERYTLEILP